MRIFEKTLEMGHEQIVFGQDPSCGYRGIIAIHSTVLGAGAGGIRFWHYATEEEALFDVLRLSRGMTYKAAVAGLSLGGGKSVIIGDPKVTGAQREAIFRAHGRLIESLGGRYLAAEDVGTSPADIDVVHQETRWVGGLESKDADPSPATARGVFRSIQAAARHRWGSDDLAGRTVAIQGLGNVGYRLARELHAAGARLVVADIDEARARRVAGELGARVVATHEIYTVPADVFAPCALGAVLNDTTIPQLEVEVVCGAANNQLLEDRHGDMLVERGILYVPDYVANGGGIIKCYRDFSGWDLERSRRGVEEIYDTVLGVLRLAGEEGIPTYRAADRVAERRLEEAKAVAAR